MQLAHFLEADVEHWASLLAAVLFPKRALPAAATQPSAQLQGCATPSEATPACSTLAGQADAWRHLDELAPPVDVIDAILRASPMPLLKQLPLTPAEWQPAVISSHAANGALEMESATSAACRGATHAVHDVHSVSLRLQPELDRERLARALQVSFLLNRKDEYVLALHAVAAMPMLRTLHLEIHFIIVTDVEDTLAPLSRLSRLQSLRLAVGSATAVAALTQRLRALTALTALDLSDNWLCSANAKALAPVLSRLSRLERLQLAEIGAPGIAALAQPLGMLTALTALGLSSIGLGYVGAEALARALSCLSRLETLQLDKSRISAAGAAALAQPLGAVTALTALDLRFNALGPAGVEALALSRLLRLASVTDVALRQ